MPPAAKEYRGREVGGEALALKPEGVYAKATIEHTRWACAWWPSIVPDAGLPCPTSAAFPTTPWCLPRGGNRPLPSAGANGANVHYLRAIEESRAIGDAMAPGRSLVVIGGGYIGLEVAAIGIKHGLKVTVLVRGPRVLARVTGPEMSGFYERVHRRAGVDVRSRAAIERLETEQGRFVAVVLASGERIPADLLVIGNGLVPDTELAQAASIEVGDGILVDAHARGRTLAFSRRATWPTTLNRLLKFAAK